MRASSIAFSLFLALIPSLIALFTLIPYVPIEDLHREVYTFLRTLMPSAAFQTIEGILNDVLSTRSGSLFSVGLIAAIYFASNGVFALMTALYKDNPTPFWRLKLSSIGLTVLLGILLIGSMSLFLLTQLLIQFFGYATHLNTDWLYYVVIIAQWAITFLLIVGAITIIYRQSDPRTERWRHIMPGAAMAGILMLVTSVAYSYYVGRWANYSKLYGSLGALIITMLWLYFNSMVIIIGHDFNRSLVNARVVAQSQKRMRLRPQPKILAE